MKMHVKGLLPVALGTLITLAASEGLARPGDPGRGGSSGGGSSSHLSYVLASIKNKYPGVSDHQLWSLAKAGNKTDIRPGDLTKPFLCHAVRIPTAEQRKSALDEVQKNPPRRQDGSIDDRLTFYMRLALLDDAAWIDYIQGPEQPGGPPGQRAGGLGVKGTPTHEIMNPVVGAFMMRIPTDYKSKIADWIGEVYEGASKEAPVRGILPGKRALDGVLKWTVNPYAAIHTQLAAGKSPEAAYEALLHDGAQHFPKGSPVGKYDSALVRRVVKVLQRSLIEAAPSELDLGDGNVLSHDDIALTVVGSFPNGRAKLASSDIDLAGISSSPKILAWLRDDLKTKINAALDAEFGGKYNDRPFGLKVSEIHDRVFDELQMAQLGPVMIRIKPGSVQLVTYSSASENEFDNYRFMTRNSGVTPPRSQLPAVRVKEFTLPW